MYQTEKGTVNDQSNFGNLEISLLSFFFWQISGTLHTFRHFLAKSWQIFGKKEEIGQLLKLVFVFLQNFGTNFGGTLEENQPKKCWKVNISEFGFTYCQCISQMLEVGNSLSSTHKAYLELPKHWTLSPAFTGSSLPGPESPLRFYHLERSLEIPLHVHKLKWPF